MLPLEFLKCVETGRPALTVPELLLVLFSKFSTIYGLNKLLYCQSCEHRRKSATVIVARSSESYLLGRQMSGHQLQHRTINLVCAPGQGACGWRCPEWMQGGVTPPSLLTSHHGLITVISKSHLLSPPLRRYSTLGLSAVSTYYQLL